MVNSRSCKAEMSVRLRHLDQINKMRLTEEQIKVKDKIVSNIMKRKSCCLVGAAGTGKTTTLRFIYNQLKVNGFKITACAPTHQASEVLRNSLNCQVATIASVLKKKKEINFDTGEVSFNPASMINNSKGVIIIDESSMLEPHDVLAFIDNYPKSTFLFVGDSEQLPPVENTNFCIFDEFPKFELKTNMRCGHGNEMFDLIERIRHGNFDINIKDNVKSISIEEMDGTNPIIVFTNEKRRYWNELILNKKTNGIINESVLFMANENIGYNRKTSMYKIKNGEKFNPTKIEIKQYVSRDMKFETTYFNLTLANGETVPYLTTNEKIRLNNYLKTLEGNWIMYYDVKNNFPDVDLAYSITSHKSQGSTYPSAIVDYNDIMKINDFKMKKASLYVAFSRSQTEVFVII